MTLELDQGKRAIGIWTTCLSCQGRGVVRGCYCGLDICDHCQADHLEQCGYARHQPHPIIYDPKPSKGVKTSRPARESL